MPSIYNTFWHKLTAKNNLKMMSEISSLADQDMTNGEESSEIFSVSYSKSQEQAVVQKCRPANSKGTAAGIRKGKWLRYCGCGILLVLSLLALSWLAFRHKEQGEKLADYQTVIDTNSDMIMDGQKTDIDQMDEEIEWKKFVIKWKREEINWTQLARIELHRRMLEMMSNDNATIAKQLEQANEAIAFCKSALTNWTTDYYNAMGNYHQQIYKAYDLRSEYWDLSYVLRQHQKGINQLKEDNKTRIDRQREMENRSAEIHGQTIGITEKIAEFMKIRNDLNLTYWKQEGEVANLDKIIEDQNQRLGHVETLLAQSRSQLNESANGNFSNSALANLRVQLNQRDWEITELTVMTQNSGTNGQARAMQNFKVDIVSTHQSHVSAVKSVESQMADLQKQIDSLNAQISDKQQTINAKDAKYNGLQHCWWTRYYC